MGEVTRLHGIPSGADREPARARESARGLYGAGRWSEARELLTGLPDPDAADLEFRGTIAYLLGDARAYFEDLGTAFRQYTDPADAARCAAWLAVMHLIRGEAGHSSGWLATARRLVDEHGECAASAYLEVTPILADQSARRDHAIATAHEMNQIARRHHDVDAVALTGQTYGQLLIRTGQPARGRELMDEAMVMAGSGQLSSSLVEILAYLAVMEGCRLLGDVTRAREWTTSIDRLRSRSPELKAFTGILQLRRAELAFLGGDPTSAFRDVAEVLDAPLQGDVWLLRGDILRTRGDLDGAEHAYDQALAHGRSGPGKALLHLARSENELARGLIRRILAEQEDSFDRAASLPAAVRILLESAADEAAVLAEELASLAVLSASPLLEARARHAAGLVALHRGEPELAVTELRRAINGFTDLRIRGELLESRIQVAHAYALLGERALGELENDRARALAAELGVAAPPAVVESGPYRNDGLLSTRELQVLRMVAGGSTNREIAEELVLSIRTVDRHVSNILMKIEAPSRAAAVAYAVEHSLL